MTEIPDYVIIGSGFGGSVSAMRLAEKGYSVVVLERGERYEDSDFAKSNWRIDKYLWKPSLGLRGILQLSFFQDVVVLHGCGVGGGSLGYACVLMQPEDEFYHSPAWDHLGDWKTILEPHFKTARRMLGVAQNPKFWKADEILRECAGEIGKIDSFQPVDSGIFFGEPGKDVPDPYFGGEGPARQGCIHCGGCMVGCRRNAKNTLMKNYLYFAEKWGAKVLPNTEAIHITALPDSQPDGARYEVSCRSTAWGWFKPKQRIRCRNVILSAGTLGTLRLLFYCRDISHSLERLSSRLGDLVRTNSESLLGVTVKDRRENYAEGIAITSIFQADPETTVEPVRYPAGSSLMRYLSAPMAPDEKRFIIRLCKVFFHILTHPGEFFFFYIWPGWSQRTTILLVMQKRDNALKLRLGRNLLTLFQLGLISAPDKNNRVPSRIEIGHLIAKKFAGKVNGFPASSVFEGLMDIPLTAHILGGCPFGRNEYEGVVGLDCQVHNYPGLYVVDGSIIPANPGVNPSLTITALAEYAMSQVPPKSIVDESRRVD